MKHTEAIIDLLRTRSVIRPRDLTNRGISTASLYWLYQQGQVIRTGRGLYMLPDAQVSEHHSLVEAIHQVPNGIICLLSALHFHRLGTQMPFEVWMAIDNKAHRPRVDYPSLRFVRFSGRAFTEGIDEHRIEGLVVPVYGLAKTVADCFKYRNKIGLDVALEALRECWFDRRCSQRDLWYYAEICRVANVMKPYLESLT